MIKPADKRAAFAAACMLVAGIVMLGLGVIALLVHVSLGVAGLFLTMSVPCGIVAFSLGNIAMRGRQPAASSPGLQGSPGGAAGSPPSLEPLSETAPAE